MATINTFKHEENVVSYSAGETIFEEETAGHIMYIVQHGMVDIFVKGKLIETVGENGVVGEMAIIDSTARSATAVAKTDCILVPLDEAAFQTIDAGDGEALLASRLLSQAEVEALLAGGPAILLTDQYAPVDQMLAPVVREEGGE